MLFIVGKLMPLHQQKYVHLLIHSTYKSVTLSGKTDFADVIKGKDFVFGGKAPWDFQSLI